MKSLGLSSESLMVLLAFVCYLIGVMALGIWSHRLSKKGNFVKNYFVGGRQLGAWVLALSVAGTAISGGSFTGFPALIYTNGWVMALWIASYMVVPLTAMALMGKRLNQIARVQGSVTVPDVFRDRFNSPTLGLVATILIFCFLVFNMVAQFKSGGMVLRTALDLPKVELSIPILGGTIDQGYLIGLCIFAFTVVAYTTYGGFWAVTWTDVLEGIVKIVGVTMLAILAVRAVADVTMPSGETVTGLSAATERLRQQDPALAEGPGPSGFLPLSMAFSFFLMWSLSSAGQPSGMVRLMSFKDSQSLRKAMIVVCGYYLVTYSCLVIIFICARAMYPTEFLASHGGIPDSVMPEMARRLAPHPFIAGMLLASPYAAVMSAVAAFLLVISSSLVRDIYQRSINPNVTTKTMKYLSYTVTTLVGVGVLIAALKPPTYLQYLVVFTGTGQSSAFFFPMLGCLYWRRATKRGMLAGMLGGGLTVLSLYIYGWTMGGEGRHSSYAPYYLLTFDPIFWGLSVSLLMMMCVSWMTKTDPNQIAKYFPDSKAKA
ncbi:MAG: sodium transporter [Planctomycetes bacterium]|nr:sodium transporter [Planctomycetota bacterium]